MRIKFGSTGASTVRINAFSGGVDYRSDESVGSAARAKECRNFDFSDGALKPGYGISDCGVSRSVKAAWRFRRFDETAGEEKVSLLLIGDDGKLYERKGSSEARAGSAVFTSVPVFIGYRLYGKDVALICSEKDGTWVYDGVNAPYEVDDAPAVTSATVHAERLFVTVGGERNAVWFSDDLDPTNWDASLTGAGFIEFTGERGAVNRVVGFLGYVYAFRERGVTRISAYGSQSTFSVSDLFVSSGKIYPKTVTTCGDVALFLSDEGVCGFDGASTKRLLPSLAGLVKGEGAVGAYFGGKYYLAFSYEGKSEVNDALLVYDPSDGSYSISNGFSVVGFCDGGDELLAVTAGGSLGKIERCGAAFGLALPKRWRIPRNDWGSSELKTVRELSIYTRYPCRAVLRGDGGRTRTISFSGADDVQKKRVNFSARRFGVDIETDEANVDISRPSFKFAKGG